MTSVHQAAPSSHDLAHDGGELGLGRVVQRGEEPSGFTELAWRPRLPRPLHAGRITADWPKLTKASAVGTSRCQVIGTDRHSDVIHISADWASASVRQAARCADK